MNFYDWSSSIPNEGPQKKHLDNVMKSSKSYYDRNFLIPIYN